MKLNSILLLASLVSLGTSCNISAPASPTNPTIPVPTTLIPVIPATSTPLPSQTAAEATLAPGTSMTGAYLTYLRDQGNGQEFIMMDADGIGEVAFPFLMSSNINMPPSLSNLVSPDGTWLAFYTGSAGQAFGHVGTDTADLTLNLMNLSNTGTQAGSTQVIVRLLSTDYPANFALAAQELESSDYSAQGLQDALVSGITQSIAWSPDSQHLAFAGQMNGYSSDLYLYNIADGTIQQLSSGPEEVQWIEWSPDGKWILAASSYWVGEGMTVDLFATTVDGKIVHRLFENTGIDGGPTWINAHAFLVYHSSNGPGNSWLERADIENGNVDKVWDGSIDSLAIDTSGAWLALHDMTSGLFLLDLENLKSTKVQGLDATHEYGANQGILSMSSEPGRTFLTRDNTGLGLYYLSTNGVLTSTGTSADLFSVAPNHADWIAVKDNIQELSAGGSQTRNFNFPDGTNRGNFQKILWRPDSSGVFLVSSDGKLYSLDLSSGQSTIVESHLSNTGPAGLVWVRK